MIVCNWFIILCSGESINWIIVTLSDYDSGDNWGNYCCLMNKLVKLNRLVVLNISLIFISVEISVIDIIGVVLRNIQVMMIFSILIMSCS